LRHSASANCRSTTNRDGTTRIVKESGFGRHADDDAQPACNRAAAHKEIKGSLARSIDLLLSDPGNT
jgi:hypothetical protein